jgi:hypothetical protein
MLVNITKHPRHDLPHSFIKHESIFGLHQWLNMNFHCLGLLRCFLKMFEGVPHVEKSSIFSLFSCTIFQLSYNNQCPKIALKQFLEDHFKKNFYIRIDV